MFKNPRRSRQARNFTTNAPKILDLKSSSEQIFSRKLSLGAPVQSMRFTSNVAKSSAVILQIHVPSPLPTQYNVERSKELCLDGFNTVRGVGGGGRDV